MVHELSTPLVVQIFELYLGKLGENGLYAIVPEEVFKFFTERGCFQPPPMSNRVNI